MDTKTIDKYLNLFSKLNRGYTKGLGKAPHKPILLISIIELIRKKEISSNRIFITTNLVLTFKNNWDKLVVTNHSQNFALPFFHMRSEPFWNLVTKFGMELNLTNSRSIKSFKNLNENISFAEIDKDLFFILSNQKLSNSLLSLLLNKYFPASHSNYFLNYDNSIEREIENQILNENPTEYRNNLNELKSKLDNNSFEEELFIRGGLFKKTIPKIYNYSCCISGWRIESTTNSQMVDACHIIPFSISKDDTIPNGISLSPNLHRAFDRGLITINKDYIVRVSPTITNPSNNDLHCFEGKQILLPSNAKWYPSVDSLFWHNKEIYKL
ncbi:MAG: HNH endonuclease [Bacteroidetes bacterium MedPE-SWsnd-G2]|nr:MAG: HNH endonuclease [Bacteroidetes bacterium MedPE-SWsnd-G2]